MPPEPATLPASAAARFDRIAPAWRTPLLALAAAWFALIAATAPSWGEMLHQWWNIDTYNHLLLVPFIIGWLVMLKAGELARITPQPFLPGLALVAAALAVWWAGRAADINLIAHAGAVGAVQAAVLTVLGLRASLLLALPLAMGAFLVPFGDEIIPPLQFITADITVALTRWSGVPANIDGIYINTPAGLFIVAEACSGVKFLIAMVTLGVLVAFTRFASWRRRAAFLVACIIIPILANGVRAWATVYVAQYVGAEAATGFDHIVYGWIFFAVIAAALLAGAWRFFEREPEDYGWRADDLTAWGWLTRAEGFSIAPTVPALVIAAMAAIAALAAML
ncbi:MAG: exosortase A [Alphaproteobacteria bacterium HGW-Alphaproteobacteria-7]|jgi:exosortase A|nr:MAG: exosortase A [Alphaproteobacteria bacterium HGW-Alphaproteobacteria-7]